MASQASQASQASHPRSELHTLPHWFVAFQDTAGLSLLVIALMGINGVVYASGVVPNVEDPSSWGIFHGLLFVLFFLAGAAMPGVALRAGAGIFLGAWYRRLACLVVSLLFFALEVWCSIAERSLTTLTSPADRWLLSTIGQPNLPFSPTVLVISFAISLIVIVWGLVTGITADASPIEAAERRTLRQQAEIARAQHKAHLRAIQVGGLRQAALVAAGRLAPLQTPHSLETEPFGGDNEDGEDDEDGGDGGPAGAGLLDATMTGMLTGMPTGTDGTPSAGHAAHAARPRRPVTRNGRITHLPTSRPRGLMTATELAGYVLDHFGRAVGDEAALNLVKTTPGAVRLDAEKGQPWAASKPALIQRARQLWAELPTTKAREA